MRKGITPVVAVVILLGMTIAGAGAAYTFLTTVTQQAQNEADASFQTAVAVRDVQCEGTTATIALSNTGDRELSASRATVYIYRDGDLLDTSERDISGADVLQPGGVSRLAFPSTTFLDPGTEYRIEIGFTGTGNRIERRCRASRGGLTAYWNVDSIVSRRIPDLTGQGYDATFHNLMLNGTVSGMRHNGTRGSTTAAEGGDPSWRSDCLRGACLDFDGSDNVTVPHHQDLNITDAITVTMWVQPRPGTQHSRAIDDDGVNIYWESSTASMTDRAIRMYIRGDDGNRHYADGISRNPAQNVTAGTWTHIALTFNGTHIRQYENGTIVAENTWTGDLDGGTDDLLIGSYGAGTSRWWTGNIDDVRIYDRALSRSEIRSVQDGAPPDTGIVAYYPFDAGSGQTVWNNAFQAPGKHGKGMRFDGDTGRYLGVADDPALDIDESFTWSVWLKLREKSGDDTVFGKSSAYELTVRNSDMKIVSWGDDWHPSYTFPVGEWHHIAVTGNAAGSSRTLYIDGEQVASGGPGYTMDVSGNPLQIGRWPDQDGNGVNGTVDDLRIYDRELSGSEVRSDMQGAPPSEGNVAYYSMDGPAGRTVWNNRYWTGGKQGGGARFTTASQHARAPPTLGAIGDESFSVAVWANEGNDSSTRMPVLFRISDSDNSPRLTIQRDRRYSNDNDYIMWQLAEPDGTGVTLRHGEWLGTGTPLRWENETGWHHVVGVRDASAGEMRLYVDGVLRDSAPDTNISASLDLGQNATYLGNQILTNQAFDGTLDDLRVYRTALTADDVAALYSGTK